MFTHPKGHVRATPPGELEREFEWFLCNEIEGPWSGRVPVYLTTTVGRGMAADRVGNQNYNQWLTINKNFQAPQGYMARTKN